MNSLKTVCPSCGQSFEKKENQIFCPHCRMLLPLTDITVTDAGTALLYIVSSRGVEILKQSRIVLSMLPDIMPSCQDDIRLLRAVYSTAEQELSGFVTAVSKKRNTRESLKKLAGALHRAFLAENYMEQAVCLFLEACSLDPEQALGGPGYPVIRQRPRSLDKDRFVKYLEQIHRQKGSGFWKNPDTAAAAATDHDPALREEAGLLKRAGQTAGDELYTLMKTVLSSARKDDDEKMPAARLQAKLKSAFMDLQDIDFLVGSLLESAGLEYTQTLYHPPAAPGSAPPHRPRRSGTASGSSAASGASSLSGSGSASGTAATSGSGAAAARATKKKRSLPKLILTALVLYFVFLYVVKPVIDHFTTEANKSAAIEAQNSAGSDGPDSTNSDGAGGEDSTGSDGAGGENGTGSSGTDGENGADSGNNTATASDPYPAPSVSTSSTQSGLYAIGNIASPSRYARYQGPDNTFSFSYPRVLYDDVSYTFENDGQDIDIVFSCAGDPSSLSVFRHPVDTSAQEYRDAQMDYATGSVNNAEILADRKSMSGALADTRSQERYTLYVKGTDKENPDIVIYQLYSISSECIQGMVLKYPEASGTEDLALKEYYAQVMYDLCGFGGNTDYPSWNDFKSDYL
ncbi:MAG TPA: hypothetical protein H9955_17265 [Candidatus Mediterraneibacter cottocaccae]|nr:hypothetical protein [Candidatus Mediterraneibacter cottocaccae]